MRLFIIIPMSPAAPVTAKISAVFIKLPSDIVAPAHVEEITDGILARVAMTINRRNGMPVNGAKYVKMSFGVPGMKNNKNMRLSRLSGDFRNESSSNFLIFTNLEANFIPKR